MKGGFELGILNLVAITFLFIAISLISILFSFNQAKFVAESRVETIESFNGYSNSAIRELDNYQCEGCTYQINKKGDRYQIVVSFPVKIAFINLNITSNIVSTTKSLTLEE